MENEESILKILELMDTLQQVFIELYNYASSGDKEQANRFADDIKEALRVISSNTLVLEKSNDKIKLSLGVESIEDSLLRTLDFLNKGYIEKFQNKVEFELIPLLCEAFAQFYFWGYKVNLDNGIQEYLQNDRAVLYKNDYIDEAVETGKYKYEVAFIVLAYNNLDYTKLCVESLIKNIPPNCNYELILINHGSTDGTKEYFESVNPTKLLDIKKNGGGLDACSRIIESEFVMQISNDVIITPGAIENMIACMKSDRKIAWVVPTTSNVSNHQIIRAEYNNFDEMIEFARRNNQMNSYRWEQRIRLCNPISLYRAETFLAKKGAGLNGYIHSVNIQSFPDDRISLLLRRNGYKMMLAKDSFCHHFGSITLKDEIQRKGEEEFYMKGRLEFAKAFRVDPWGTGYCYDSIFFEKLVLDNQEHVEVLGISCGIGSNSLKIKEQLKEYCKNTNVTLYNITDKEQFLMDLNGISDFAYVIQKMEKFEEFLEGRKFDYIVWDESYLEQNSFISLYEIIIGHLNKNGRLLIKKSNQNMNWIVENKSKIKLIGSEWNMIEK